MSFNPLKEKGIAMDKQIKTWDEINSKPYDKNEIDPYTKTRIILMNGIEVESTMFLHQFARNCKDPDIKRKLATGRRMEQQQQKVINWLSPANESNIEMTIGYEQVAVDLTAWLAQNEPDKNVKQALDFALLEDFDHLYRYANLMDMDKGIKAEKLVGEYTEIMPGRPTMAEHRHPMDSIRKPYDKDTADIITKLNVLTIIAGEQQTMNFYMNIGNTYDTMLGRALYAEIGQIEEQHVSHYESLMDPTTTWMENLLLHEYNECYLYYSFYQHETDPRMKKIWEQHLMMEIEHLKIADKLMQDYEGKKAEDLLPKEFPKLLKFQSNKEYVRKVLEEQVQLTADLDQYKDVGDLDKDHRFHKFQEAVNKDSAPSTDVINKRIEKEGEDYRFTSEGKHPVSDLVSRKKVNEDVGRK
jgi:hypothetical protein